MCPKIIALSIKTMSLKTEIKTVIIRTNVILLYKGRNVPPYIGIIKHQNWCF